MDYTVTRYKPRIASVRLTIALQLALTSIQSTYSTSLRSATWSRPSSLKKYQRGPVWQKSKDAKVGRQTGTQVLHFRQFADIINDGLSVTAEDLSGWIQEFLKLGSSQLLNGNDRGEVRRVQNT